VVPRLRAGGGGHSDRQRGGIGGKGAGESAAELDKRKVRDRIAELRQELLEIERDASHRRAGRTGLRRVALVGYTNAGKSSLMRALTGSGVYIADKLFATLDTTVRALYPEVRPRILVSDTVGFIQKLPHDLVASFRSTLDEAHEAGILLYVVDASDPTFRTQYQVTRTVLSEIGAESIPSRLVLNKIDRLDDAAREALIAEFPDAVLISAHAAADVARIHDLIVAFFDQSAEDVEILVPYDRGHVIGLVHENARVLEERFEDEGTVYRLRVEAAGLARIKGALGLLPPPAPPANPWD
jgi:GTP-binding protein HflX